MNLELLFQNNRGLELSNWTPETPWRVNPETIVRPIRNIDRKFITTPFLMAIIDGIENDVTQEIIRLQKGCLDYAANGIALKDCTHPKEVVYEIPAAHPDMKSGVCCYCATRTYKDPFMIQLERDMARPLVPESERR